MSAPPELRIVKPMTNEELLAALKTEIGWLRNELVRMRTEFEQIKSRTDQTNRDVKEIKMTTDSL